MIRIFENIISDEENKILSEWILSNYQSKIFTTPRHKGTKRRSTRFTNTEFKYPDAAYDIKQRILIKIQDFNKFKNIEFISDFKDSMYAAICFKGDMCSEHTDPVYKTGFDTYHCNVELTDKNDGILVVNNNSYIINKNNGILYPVSKLYHKTTLYTSNLPRMFWSFGFLLKI